MSFQVETELESSWLKWKGIGDVDVVSRIVGETKRKWQIETGSKHQRYLFILKNSPFTRVLSKKEAIMWALKNE